MLGKFSSTAIFIRATSILLLTIGSTAYSGPRDQAYRLYNRIAGVPPTPEQLDILEGLVSQGNIKEASMMAMDHDLFYNETLKKMFAPWSNEPMAVTYSRPNGTPGVILNDYTATLIGMVRDNKPFNEVLSHDYLYVGEGTGVPADLPPYAPENNDHYIQLEARRVNLKDALVERKQTELIPAIAGRQEELGPDGTPMVPAGIMTSRAFSEAYYNAGTNRAPFRFLLMTYLCEDVQTYHDTTIVTDKIRRDVERNALFVTKCQGCHAGMDGLTGAFAYMDWDDEAQKMIYSKPTAGLTLAELQDETGDYKCSNAELGNNPDAARFAEFCVRPKYRSNATEFPDGSTTVNDSWINYWNQGQNAAKIGWPGPVGVAHQGSGPRSFGELMGNTNQFATCMAKRSFRQVCFRDPTGQSELAQVNALANNFKANSYNMKNLIADAMSLCLGE
jgi:hypothetical protein